LAVSAAARWNGYHMNGGWGKWLNEPDKELTVTETRPKLRALLPDV